MKAIFVNGKYFVNGAEVSSEEYEKSLPDFVVEENDRIPEPTPEERMEAQVLYTALMTDTLLEE